MFRFIRRNVIAFVALFIALSGTAYAANTVRSADIVDGTIKSVDLANNAVTPAKATGVWTIHDSSYTWTEFCDTPNTWLSCGSYQIDVPAGHRYKVTVTSVVAAQPAGNGAVGA